MATLCSPLPLQKKEISMDNLDPTSIVAGMSVIIVFQIITIVVIKCLNSFRKRTIFENDNLLVEFIGPQERILVSIRDSRTMEVNEDSPSLSISPRINKLEISAEQGEIVPREGFPDIYFVQQRGK
jgi:hypothetical protein